MKDSNRHVVLEYWDSCGGQHEVSFGRDEIEMMLSGVEILSPDSDEGEVTREYVESSLRYILDTAWV